MHRKTVFFIFLTCLLSMGISGAEEKQGEKGESKIILMLPRIQEPSSSAFYLKLPEGVEYSYAAPSEWIGKIDPKGSYTLSPMRTETGAELTTMEFPSSGKTIKVAMAGGTPVAAVSAADFGPVPMDVEKIISFFRSFNVDIEKIEVWVQGAVESGNITRLFVSVKADAGIKVILIPKKD